MCNMDHYALMKPTLINQQRMIKKKKKKCTRQYKIDIKIKLKNKKQKRKAPPKAPKQMV